MSQIFKIFSCLASKQNLKHMLAGSDPAKHLSVVLISCFLRAVAQAQFKATSRRLIETSETRFGQH